MKLTIIGASGHGKVVADIAKLNGYDEIDFLDDNETIKFCGKYPVIGKSENALLIENDIFIAIGNNSTRRKLIKQLRDKHFPVLIHPDAIIADDVIIGKGTVVMAGVVINTGTSIGEGVIVNTCSSIDHDCMVENYVHVAVGSHLCGTVSVKENTWIGAGATVINNIVVGDDCIVGAGSVVTTNITDAGTYIGVPAKMIKKRFVE